MNKSPTWDQTAYISNPASIIAWLCDHGPLNQSPPVDAAVRQGLRPPCLASRVVRMNEDDPHKMLGTQ